MEKHIQKSLELIQRGAERIIDVAELEAKLRRATETGKPLIVKLGVDPTAPDIHLGHTVPFRKLKHFQDLGHDVCFLIGDFTGQIGDPSGRDKTRPPLSAEDIRVNAATYLEQISKILDPARLRVVYNGEWLQNLGFGELIKMAGQVTMSRLLEHNTFKQRLEQSESVRVHELLYPFMQGFDSVALKADVELGGSDQTFNLMFGRDLQKFYGQDPQVCITMPILTGTDGKQKMSKSLGNYIGINEAAPVMFEKIMRMTDANIVSYFTLLTDVAQEKIDIIASKLSDDPDDSFVIQCKKELAWEIVSIYHSAEAADLAQESYGQENKVGLPEISISKAKVVQLSEWMVSEMGILSRSQARRLMQQAGVRVNERKIMEDMPIMQLCEGDVVRVGKSKAFKIIV
jgi:tyrosyl-tRNA synthetase